MSQNDNGGFYTQGRGKKICKYRYVRNYAVFGLALDGNQILEFLKELDVFTTTVVKETVPTMLSLVKIVITSV